MTRVAFTLNTRFQTAGVAPAWRPRRASEQRPDRVPLLRGNDLVGTITIYKLDKQIALVETFASQAAIAIEKSRLLNEL